jgi:hypothetical protein
MTEQPQPPEAVEPPSPDEAAPDEFARRDELLSAALDGALVEAVGELGATAAEIAVLEAAPALARQADLRAAARALAAVPALDEITRARLVRGAIDSVSAGAAAPDDAGHRTADLTPGHVMRSRTLHRTRSRRWLVPAASVAAAAALAGGIGVALNDEDRQVADPGNVAQQEAAPGVEPATIDYGEIDGAALRLLVAQADGGNSGRSSAELNTGDFGPDTIASPESSQVEPLGTVTYDTAAAAECLGNLNPGGALAQVIGVATVAGQVGLVATADEPGARLGWVVSTDTPCAVLLSTMMAT